MPAKLKHTSTLKVGDLVRILRVPLAVQRQMPEQIRQLFRRCVGKVLRIEDIDEHGHLELWVMQNGSQAPDCTKHTIWIEPRHVRRLRN